MANEASVSTVEFMNEKPNTKANNEDPTKPSKGPGDPLTTSTPGSPGPENLNIEAKYVIAILGEMKTAIRAASSSAEVADLARKIEQLRGRVLSQDVYEAAVSIEADHVSTVAGDVVGRIRALERQMNSWDIRLGLLLAGCAITLVCLAATLGILWRMQS